MNGTSCLCSVLSSMWSVQALRPTLFIGVPRVFDKVYAGVWAKLKHASFYQRLLFNLAFWHKQRHINMGYRWETVRAINHCQPGLRVLSCGPHAFPRGE